jgi:predicted dehydrogenase
VHELLQRGKHVLVEKPAATTEAQCRHLVQLAQQKNLVLAVGNIERMNPAVSVTYDLIQNGRIGTMAYFSFRRAGAYPPRVQKGNNVCLDLAVHDFDALTLLCGTATISQVTAAAVKQRDIIDIFDASLRTREAFGHVAADWYSPERRREAQFIFSRGNLVMSYLDQTVTAYLPKDLWTEWTDTVPSSDALTHYFGLQPAVQAELSAFNDKCWKLAFLAPKINALDVQWTEFTKLLEKTPSRLATHEQLVASVALAEQALASQFLMAESTAKGLLA